MGILRHIFDQNTLSLKTNTPPAGSDTTFTKSGSLQHHLKTSGSCCELLENSCHPDLPPEAQEEWMHFQKMCIEV